MSGINTVNLYGTPANSKNELIQTKTKERKRINARDELRKPLQ